MFKLQIISFVLSVILALQMLPVAQIGKVLVNDECAEEMPVSTDEACKEDGHTYYSPVFFHHAGSDENAGSFLLSRAMAYIYHSIDIPHNHSTDVVSPPPDLY